MNARIRVLRPGPVPAPQRQPHVPTRSRAPEAIELMRRVLLLTTPASAVHVLLGVDETVWPSAAYYALARRELHRRAERTRHEDDVGLDARVSEFRAACSSGQLERVVRAVLALLDALELDDPVVLRRVLQELDVWVYERARG